MNSYVILSITSILVASISQIFLKKSSMKKEYKNRLYEYLNPLVISAYFLLLLSTVLTLFAYKGLKLSQGMMLESISYILINILSFLYFKEKMSLKKITGILCIISGIFIYSLIG